MKILLIRPPVSKYTIGLKHIMICEPLELEYVAAGLPDHDVMIFDMLLEKKIERALQEFRPDIVGTSCYITGVNEAIKVCRKVKKNNPHCITVIGGVHASVVPEDFNDASVDCIATGDGTTKLKEIVEAVVQHQPIREIPGLLIPTDGILYKTQEEKYMPDPDSLPLPRRDLAARYQYKYYYLFHQPVATIKTTWGCCYKCDFCFTWKITNGIPYSRSPESIIDELLQIDKKEIYIVDDTFLYNTEKLSKFLDLLRINNINKNFLVYGCSDYIAKNSEMIKYFSELGLKAVLVGLEATTNNELKLLDKHCTLEQNIKAIEVLRKNNVDIYGSLIMQPYYEKKDWEKVWEFIQNNKLYYLNISPFTPFPGTNIWPVYKDKITIPASAYPLWDLTHVVLPTKMKLKDYYDALLKLYSKVILDIRRANRITLRTRPPVYSLKYLKLWKAAFMIYFQIKNAYKHHKNDVLSRIIQKKYLSLK